MDHPLRRRGRDCFVIELERLDCRSAHALLLGVEHELERQEVVGLAFREVIQKDVRFADVVALFRRKGVVLLVERDSLEELEEGWVDEALTAGQVVATDRDGFVRTSRVAEEDGNHESEHVEEQDGERICGSVQSASRPGSGEAVRLVQRRSWQT